MSFDYFNTSYLAFGNKLTKAFKSLAGLLDEVDDNIDILKQQLAYYQQYINKNYKVNLPSSQGSPVQARQLYEVLKINPIILKEVSKSGEGLKVAINYIDVNNNKITYAYGENTTLSEGYCYVQLASSNDSPSKEITFLSEEDSKNTKMSSSYIRLFKYKVQSNNEIVLSQLNSLIPISPTCYDNHYSDYQLEDKTEFYTNNVSDRDVIVIVTSYESANNKSINVIGKDSSITQVLGCNNISNILVIGGAIYLKAGEKVSGDIGKVYEVKLVNHRRVS